MEYIKLKTWQMTLHHEAPVFHSQRCQSQMKIVLMTPKSILNNLDVSFSPDSSGTNEFPNATTECEDVTSDPVSPISETGDVVEKCDSGLGIESQTSIIGNGIH